MSTADGEGRVYAVAGAKGGVGKTTTATNLAAMLAATGRATVVVDADLVSASLTHALDLPAHDEESTLHGVLAGDTSIERAVHETPGRFDIVPGTDGIEAYAAASTDRLRPAIETLRDAYEVVLLDVGPGLSQDTTVPLGLADRVLLVTTPHAASVAATEKTLAVVDRLDRPTVEGLVVTQVADASEAPPVGARLATPVLAAIPTDEAVPASLAQGVPLVRSAPDAPAARAYLSLAGRQRADGSGETNQGGPGR